MVTPLRQSSSGLSDHRPTAMVVLAGAILAAFVVASDVPSAQSARMHLNPVIAKLVAGKVAYGLSTSDFSLAHAREIARAPVDWVYADMEHNPMDISALHMFLVGMTDKAMILKKGNLQPNVALFARFAPEALESQWIVKQALDIGLMGVIFNSVSTREEALAAVRNMRYPQPKESKYREPDGIRGSGPGIATWLWGLGGDEYQRHADLWPLNPDGDLFAMMLIENVEGLKNLEQIASVPGIGSLFVGSGGDLHVSMGVPQDSPQVEAGFQQVLKVCKARKIPCAISANSGSAVAKRVKEGWQIIRTTIPAVTEGRALLGEK